jgi:predicted ABC-type ATPase
LFFVAKASPDLNVVRVGNPVLLGGHNVPEDRIRTRYGRTMGHLAGAAVLADSGYVYDNSTSQGPKLIVRIGHANLQILEQPPAWVSEYLINPAHNRKGPISAFT